MIFISFLCNFIDFYFGFFCDFIDFYFVFVRFYWFLFHFYFIFLIWRTFSPNSSHTDETPPDPFKPSPEKGSGEFLLVHPCLHDPSKEARDENHEETVHQQWPHVQAFRDEVKHRVVAWENEKMKKIIIMKRFRLRLYEKKRDWLQK